MSILWRAAAELGDDDYPQREPCCYGVEVPWHLTLTPLPGEPPAETCPRCGAGWWRLET